MNTIDYQASIIVPVFQDTGILKLFMDSLWRTIGAPTKVILINDGSGRDAQEILEQYAVNHPPHVSVDLIQHAQPIGGAKSINEGLKRVVGEILFLVDSDLILLANWQEAMVSTMALRPRVGAVGALLLYPQTGGVQHCGLGFSEDIARHLFLNSQPELVPADPFQVQAVVFALCAIPVEVMRQVGLLDESFFNAYEDLDYQMRIRKLGYEVLVQPQARAYHWERSNGIHRSFNRKRNLGRFWRLWGETITPDIWSFAKLNLEQRLKLHRTTAVREFIGIDLCEDRPEATRYWQEVSLAKTATILDILDYSHSVRDTQGIWLPSILGPGSHLSTNSYLFLVHNFVRLLGNRYWIELRRRFRDSDIIVDLYGNVIDIGAIEASCWPGERVR